MKTKKKEMILRKNQVFFEPADRTAKKVQITNRHLSADDLEVLAFMSDSSVSRVARIAKLASMSDLDLLVALAASDGPSFVRRNALQRIDEVCDGHPLSEAMIEQLLPCLNEKDLLASCVVLMDMSDYDWSASCTEETVDALCAALYQTTSMYETVLLEDAFAYLAHSRRDLNSSLCACSPEKFLTKNTYAPMTAFDVMTFDPDKKDNVA